MFAPRIPRTLRIADFVLLGTVAILNVNTVPPVARFGRATLVLWVIACTAFFLPSAMAVLAALGAVSSRSVPPLRHRGRTASPEDLPPP